MHTAAKFFRLDRHDRALALLALRSLAVMSVGLRTVGFTVVQRWASGVAGNGSQPHRWCGLPPRSTVAPPAPDRIAWAVRAASRFVPGASCLVRALAAQALLGRFGYRSELRIGVRKGSDGSFAAHAWLERDGMIIIGEFEPDEYVPLASGDSRSTA